MPACIPALQSALRAAARAVWPPAKASWWPGSLAPTLASLTSSLPHHASPRCSQTHLLTPAARTAPPGLSTETPSALSPQGPKTPLHGLASQHVSLREGPSSPTFQDRLAEKGPQRQRAPQGCPVRRAPDVAPGEHARQENGTDEAKTGVARTGTALQMTHTAELPSSQGKEGNRTLDPWGWAQPSWDLGPCPQQAKDQESGHVHLCGCRGQPPRALRGACRQSPPQPPSSQQTHHLGWCHCPSPRPPR